MTLPGRDARALGGEILTAALELAGHGIRVFPVFGARQVVGPRGAEWRCACGDVACHNPAKHPVGRLVPNGHNGAVTAVEQLLVWFAVPTAAQFEAAGGAWVPWNLGVATGRGLVVVDADVKQTRTDLPNGLEVIDNFEAWSGGVSLPATRQARTGSGGLHLWYGVDPHLRVAGKNRVLPGLDIKADGGYVLAAPSVHISGGQYHWEDPDGHLGSPAGPELTSWLLAAKGGRYIQRRAGAAGADATEPDGYDFKRILGSSGCTAGHRDFFINDLCFRLRRANTELRDAAAALRREWERMEQPSGDEFSWDDALYKLRRVWDEVQPEEVTDLPAWRPGGQDPRPWTEVPGVDPAAAPEDAAFGLEVGELHAVAAPSALELLDRPELTLLRSDTGNARRFAERMRDVVRFCRGENRWYIWEAGRWRADDLNLVTHWTEEIIKDIYVEAAKAQDDGLREALEKWAHTSQSAGHREAMLRLASAAPGMAVRPDDLDADPWLLNVRNGTVDLRTGQLRAVRPADLVTRQAGATFDPAATCPQWEAHVEFVTRGDKLLAEYLRQAVGYSLTGSTAEQKLFFLQGNGQNGKSTFVDVLSKLLGDYAVQGDENLLTSTSGHPTQLADLRGCRLVVCDETDREKKLAEQRIKMLTGKTLKARFMRQDFFQFTPRFKLWVSGNHKPEIRGTDLGIWRRLKLVPFTALLTEDRRILDYEEILEQELPGILNWALEGLRQWREAGGLGEAAVVTQATREYRDEEDVVGLWLADCVNVGVPDVYATNERLYESYRWWCTANGVEKIVSAVVLGRDLSARGFAADKVKLGGTARRVRRGLEIRSGE